MAIAMSNTRRIRLIATALIAMPILVGFVTSAVYNLRARAWRANCLGLRIGLIGKALEEYHADEGHFPPAYVLGKDGRPAHSWRVLLLPYLGYHDLYSRYNFGEPWNGPNNRLLADEMPMEYRCPATTREGPYTNYVVVVGPETPWPGNRASSYKNLKNHSAMILFVEVADSAIHWMEPCDLTLEEATAGVNKNRQRGISSNHPGGACCGSQGGTPEFLENETPPEVLRARLTVRGGDSLK